MRSNGNAHRGLALALVLAWTARPAHAQVIATLGAELLSWQAVFDANFVPIAITAGLLLALVAAGLVALGWEWSCRKLVGGQTGDLIGALGALIEVTVLAVLLVFA